MLYSRYSCSRSSDIQTVQHVLEFGAFLRPQGKLCAPYSALEATTCSLIFRTGIPEFTSHEEHRRHILIHTAAVFRDFSRKGFTEGQSGHISVRDPEFEHYIWMNPLGKHFGLMTAGDLICLDVNTGKVVGGNKVRAPLILILNMLSSISLSLQMLLAS